MPEIPRLSGKEMLILQMLVGGGQAYGLGLVRNSGGKLKRGTVYVTLMRMEEKGYVESRTAEIDGELPRRLYKPTGYGVRVLSAWEAVGARLAT
jgi:DNA-binding PadR family transcriptional regulator